MADRGTQGNERPTLLERLIAWRLGAPESDYVVGDLEERFRVLSRERSPFRARLWYWRQAMLVLVTPSVPRGRLSGTAMTGFAVEVRVALRSLCRRPAQSLLAVGALAVGVGLVGSVFSILDGTVLRGLPLEESERLVHFERANVEDGVSSLAVTPHDWIEWQARQRSFEELGAYVEAVAVVPGDHAPPTRHWGVFISAASFPLLRVQAALGRTFTQEDEQPGGAAVVLLSHRLWSERFGADRDLIGRDVVINGTATTVVGVMPAGFGFPIAEEFWFPLRMSLTAIERGTGRLDVFGRLRAGISLETARREFAAISGQLADAYPATNANIEAVLRTFPDEYVGDDFRRTVWAMLAAAGLVLLICCANVANLRLSHAWGRRHDFVVRTALGASIGRLIRVPLLEAVLLSVLGIAIGIAIAQLGVRWFNVAGAQAGAFALPHGSDSLFWWDVRLDAKAILVVAGAGALAAVLAGLVPALIVSRRGTHASLRNGTRGSAGRTFSRVTRTLVMTEFALATGLLVAAGFFVQSVVNIARENQRLDGRHVHIAGVTLPLVELGLSEDAYPDHDAHVGMADRLLTAIGSDAGVSAVAFGTVLPLEASRRVPFMSEAAEPIAAEDLPVTGVAIISPHYFGAFGVSVEEGRDFGVGDVSGSEPIVIVNRTFADLYLARRTTRGARIRLGGLASAEPWLTVIGVVPDLWSDRERPVRQAGVYLPLAQSGIGDASIRLGRFGLRFQNVVVRERGSATGLAGRLRLAVYGLDPDLPVTVRSFEEIVAQRRGSYRVWSRFYFAFAATALCLAALGVYAVLSFRVASQTAEIGIRRAIGATAGVVQRAVLRDAIVQASIGIGTGLLVGVWVTQGLARIVYEVDTSDPRVFAIVALVLAATTVLAGWLPARRAARVDPAMAMRTE